MTLGVPKLVDLLDVGALGMGGEYNWVYHIKTILHTNDRVLIREVFSVLVGQ